MKSGKQPRPAARRRWLALALGIAAAGALGWLALIYALSGPPLQHPTAQTATAVPAAQLGAGAAAAPPAAAAKHLRVLSLNLAHGRAAGRNQVLLSTATIRANLAAVAAVLRRERPDVVALQEADGPSAWSGFFDHVEHVASLGGLRFFARAPSVEGLGLSYGTALLSRSRPRYLRGVTFAPSPPTPSKGYLAGTVDLGRERGLAVRVVAVHLDFARPAVRQRQVQQLVADLAREPRLPLIIMGDFNCQLGDDEPTLRRLLAQLGLHTCQPTADLITFRAHRRRLDWILISRSLQFADCRVLDDTISDHQPVIADVQPASPDPPP